MCICFRKLNIISSAIAFFGAFIVSAQVKADEASVYLTFRGAKPGIAEVCISDAKIQNVRRLGPDQLSEPFKIVSLAQKDGRVVVFAAVGGKEAPALEIISLPENISRSLPLRAEISDLSLAGEHVIVAASKGLFYKISSEGKIIAEFNARKKLNPPGRKGEHIRPLPDGKRALVSFQKDDDNSPAKGQRLMLLDLESFEPLEDILLPRNKPELHLPNDPRDQGPGPEVVVFFPESGIVAVTLDLYGAVLFAKLSDLSSGVLGAADVVSSAADGSFGTAFPDRVLSFTKGERDWLLVSNASPNGGFALFDATARRMVRHFKAKAGAEMPVQCGERIASVISGKTKIRTAEDVKKTFHPARELHIFDFPQPSSASKDFVTGIVHRVLPLPFDPVNILAISENVIFVTGNDENGAFCVLLDPATGELLASSPLPGPPTRASLVKR